MKLLLLLMLLLMMLTNWSVDNHGDVSGISKFGWLALGVLLHHGEWEIHCRFELDDMHLDKMNWRSDKLDLRT